MTDPMPAVRSILGMPGSELPPVPSRTVLFAETHNVLVDIATQLRIANLIAYTTAHPGWVDIPAAREQIEKELFS